MALSEGIHQHMVEITNDSEFILSFQRHISLLYNHIYVF